MADTRDFLPEAGPPLAEKSLSGEGKMDELEARCAAYVIRCVDGVLYKGATRDMAARWRDHLAGRVRSTQNRQPLKLVVVEYFDTFAEAQRRERFFKSGVGRAQLKARVVKWQTQGT